MLRSYRFEHPNTEAMELVTRGSYVAAAFFGPAYILYRKTAGFWPSALVTLALTGGIVGFWAASLTFLSNRMLLIALPAALVVALMIQSSFVIQQVRRSFRRRGWLVRAP
jgi:hypothetical protein